MKSSEQIAVTLLRLLWFLVCCPMLPPNGGFDDFYTHHWLVPRYRVTITYIDERVNVRTHFSLLRCTCIIVDRCVHTFESCGLHENFIPQHTVVWLFHHKLLNTIIVQRFTVLSTRKCISLYYYWNYVKSELTCFVPMMSS